jgi:hypothetical protein
MLRAEIQASITVLVGENASTMEPASLLAIFIAYDGADLTIFDK